MENPNIAYKKKQYRRYCGKNIIQLCKSWIKKQEQNKKLGMMP